MKIEVTTLFEIADIVFFKYRRDTICKGIVEKIIIEASVGKNQPHKNVIYQIKTDADVGLHTLEQNNLFMSADKCMEYGREIYK